MRPSMSSWLCAWALVACAAAPNDTAASAYVPGSDWIVTVEAASERLRNHSDLLLDARSALQRTIQPIARARGVNWDEFSPEGPPEARGTLSNDLNRLETRLRSLGVRNDTPVLVFGDTLGGWGEEGRIVWMLRTLGHPNVAMVDGGHRALAAAGVAELPAVEQAQPGDFVVRHQARWVVQTGDVSALLQTRQPAVFVDTRSRAEFDGATPYGEARGGHLPGAVHLHYRQLLTPGGQLLSRDRIMQALQAQGIRPTTGVVPYCTGGVRSAWLVVLLVDLGFANVRNYAGSMWEWSALDAERYPLVRTASSLIYTR